METFVYLVIYYYMIYWFRYQASEDYYQNCRFILGTSFWSKKNILYTQYCKKESATFIQFVAHSVFKGNNFGNLDTF